MATATVNLTEISAQWRIARKLYVVYSALVRAFELGELCPELETPINRSEPEIIARIQQWYDAVDAKVEVHQIRQLLQATQLSTEENIRLLLNRQLKRPERTAGLRDKVDYLLVQYFAHCAPADSHNRKMSHEEVAEVLHPILGDVDSEDLEYSDEIGTVLGEIDRCHSLADLLNGGLLEKVRGLKAGNAENFFSPAVLVSFTRLNYLIRLGFFRLMHADLHAIRHVLHQIELRGQKTVDCSRAGLAKEESVSGIKQVCHEWKKPFRAAYSAGKNFRQLVEIRAAVENALTQPFIAKEEKSVAAAAVASVAHVPNGAPKLVSQPQETKQQDTAPQEKRRIAIGGKGAIPQDVEACLEQLALQLLSAKESVSVSHVMFGNTKLLLASWELAAFLKGGDEISDTLQRAVAARAFLTMTLESHAAGEPVDVHRAVQAAHAEVAALQSRVEDAKYAKNIDAAVNLAASGKRLQALIAQAEKK